MYGRNTDKRLKDWEEIDCYTKRLKVVNGWVVHVTTPMPCESRGDDSVGPPMVDDSDKFTVQISTSMTYVPDGNHKWKLDV